MFCTARSGVVSPRTLEWYSDCLNFFRDWIGDVEVAEVSLNDLRRWRGEMMDTTLSVHTVHSRLRAVRRFFSWLEAEEVIAENPAERLELPSLPDPDPKAISRDNQEKMIAAAPGVRDRAILLFTRDTGCRLGEVAGLQVEDVDLERRRAVVWGKGRGGQGKARAVYFGEATTRALEEYLATRKSGDPRVWLGLRGPLTRRGIYQVFQRVADVAGIEENWNPHAWRHAYAQAFLWNGGELGTLSQLMGHSDVSVTISYYARWSDGQLAEMASRYAPWGKDNS